MVYVVTTSYPKIEHCMLGMILLYSYMPDTCPLGGRPDQLGRLKGRWQRFHGAFWGQRVSFEALKDLDTDRLLQNNI